MELLSGTSFLALPQVSKVLVSPHIVFLKSTKQHKNKNPWGKTACKWPVQNIPLYFGPGCWPLRKAGIIVPHHPTENVKLQENITNVQDFWTEFVRIRISVRHTLSSTLTWNIMAQLSRSPTTYNTVQWGNQALNINLGQCTRSNIWKEILLPLLYTGVL